MVLTPAVTMVVRVLPVMMVAIAMVNAVRLVPTMDTHATTATL
jgi:hypothetical protein